MARDVCMDDLIARYTTELYIGNEGIMVTLTDGSKHLITNDEITKLSLLKYIKDNLATNLKIFTGWLGGEYEKLGSYDDQKDAERGMIGGEYLHELFDEYKGKKVRITIEEI